MQQTITISVITITYNAATVLQRTLDSVAHQTYQHIEHLIIDGASKDDTLAIAHRYAEGKNYPVVIQSEPDKGIYDAMKAQKLLTPASCRQSSPGILPRREPFMWTTSSWDRGRT